MPQPLAVLQRFLSLPDRTLGDISIYDRAGQVVVRLCTLELPWVDEHNDGISDRSVSRIPAASYEVRPWNSTKFPGTFRLSDPPGRSAILIHAGNHPRNTHGCILVGLRHDDLDRDGVQDLAASRAAVKLLRRTFGKSIWRLVVHDPSTPALLTPDDLEKLKAAEIAMLSEENGHPTAPETPTPDHLA
jgi:hypothetical protein